MPAYPKDESDDISASLGRLPSGSPVSAVTTKLLELFTSGQIAPGTRLPPERQLAATLEVGRSAVREALAALEVLGVVDVRPGSGTYLRSSTSELLPQSLSWGILIGRRSTEELVEVRGALEIYAARLAAERMTPEASARLDAHLAEMAAHLDDLPAFVEADLQFHLELAHATGNSVLVDLLQIIRSLLRVWVDRAVEDAGHARAALDEHTAVRDAIASGDGDAAASAMAAHMQTAGRRLTAAAGG
ncbi:FadR/GntR family transcriptional regulator [Protaetiibacter intestinalis]|uniref:FadR family transcriptional regulator n=1 Tax=Protaetiibacter intestinalis TaxID=2419774 RepID=A0A387B6H4_9MICO|nr:FadR/GntR family transcriptional regulator [Protaetiibacter intestinalis]AYF97348.1 FadR family transcriptional regulator [Protaetiibacter intestinalis]